MISYDCGHNYDSEIYNYFLHNDLILTIKNPAVSHSIGEKVIINGILYKIKDIVVNPVTLKHNFFLDNV
jgi:cysteinyl-tRNA synthetase